MVKIRLMRVGKKKQPMWRVVVADSRSPRDGRIIESIGHYQPRQEPSLVNIDNERAVYWLQKGAQPSSSVRHLLQISGAWTDFTGEPAKTLPGEAAAAPKLSKKKKATVAASVTESEEGDAEQSPAEEAATEEAPAEVPEAVDQEAAAPDAEPDDTKE